MDIAEERQVVENKLENALRNTNLIVIMQNYTNADTGRCVDMIKASVNHGADYLDNAIKDFMAQTLAE